MNALARLILLVTLVACAGCSMVPGLSGEKEETPEVTAMDPAAAYVFVGSKQKGVTPATIHVRRGFGERDVTLRMFTRAGKSKEVRRYELESAQTSNQNELVYSYRSDNFGGMVGFNAEDLPQRKNGSFIIPYMPMPIRIEDRQFNLTLIVEN